MLAVLRIVRETKRVGAHLDALATPRVDVAQLDVAATRIDAALDRTAELGARAALAAATIRRGPIPPELVAAWRATRIAVRVLRAVLAG